MRTPIIAGNWKMHKSLEEFRSFCRDFFTFTEQQATGASKVILFPPYLYLNELSEKCKQSQYKVSSGAQNCHFENKGAFTGEISPEMIRSCGGEFVIIGHSERRELFCEDDTMIAKKIEAVRQNGLIPVFCCGESENERTAGKHFDVIKKQLQKGLKLLNPDSGTLVIAYEPVWAIGTGKTATPEDAQEMHHFIRKEVSVIFGEKFSENVPILYGGSVKPSNCTSLFNCADIDGALIGGASLNTDDFISIILEMEKQMV